MTREEKSQEKISRLQALHQEQKRVSFHYRPLAFFFYLLYGSIFIGLGLWPLGMVYLGTLAFLEWRYWLINKSKLGSRALLLWAWLTLFVQSLLSVLMVGPHAGFQFYLLASLAQAFSSPNTSLRYKNVYGVIITLFFIACDTWFSSEDALYQLPSDTLHLLLIINIIGISIVLAWTAHSRAMAVRDAEKNLEKIASTDPLTGVLNRRAVRHAMERELALSLRARQPLSLILCDIDHFKQVNDNWGHDVGDLVLTRVTHCLQQELREYDFLARWGGEEFLVVLPNTSLQTAQSVAERLRTKIESMPVQLKEQVLSVTLTLGVAQVAEGETLQDTINRADELLYQGKRKGRNQVASALFQP